VFTTAAGEELGNPFEGIAGQLGRARWAGTSPAQESTALTQSGPGACGLVPGPCQAPGRAWAAITARGTSTGPARGTSTGPARQRRRHGEARPRPVRHGGGPMGHGRSLPPPAPPVTVGSAQGRRSARWGLGYISPGAGRPPPNPNHLFLFPAAARLASLLQTLLSSLTLSPLGLSLISLSSRLPELR